MELSRLRAGEALAGLAALALLVLLSLDWVQPERAQTPGAVPGWIVEQGARTGWSGLGVVVVVLVVLTVLSALALAVLTVSTHASVGPSIGAAVITSALGIVTTLVLLVRLTLGQPDLGAGLADDEVDVLTAAWLGLLACALVAAGGWTSMADERRDAPYNAPPELEPRPIPELREPLGSGRPQAQ